jgi:hypothetical protein
MGRSIRPVEVRGPVFSSHLLFQLYQQLAPKALLGRSPAWPTIGHFPCQQFHKWWAAHRHLIGGPWGLLWTIEQINMAGECISSKDFANFFPDPDDIQAVLDRIGELTVLPASPMALSRENPDGDSPIGRNLPPVKPAKSSTAEAQAALEKLVEVIGAEAVRKLPNEAAVLNALQEHLAFKCSPKTLRATPMRKAWMRAERQARVNFVAEMRERKVVMPLDDEADTSAG